MKIAIINLEDSKQLKYVNDAINIVVDNIIDPQIDLFIQKEYVEYFESIDVKYNINPIDMKNINILNIKNKYTNLRYYSRNDYDIAVDMQGSCKTSIITYLLAGRTAGFKLNGFKKICSFLFYDEQINVFDLNSKDEKLKRLLSKPFGI